MKTNRINKISNKEIVPPAIIHKIIAELKKAHYLGSTNLKGVNQTGDLNGFYRNRAAGIIHDASVAHKYTDALFVLYSAATVDYVGTGNCGEMTAAAVVRLLSDPNLSEAQRRSVKYKQYKTKDEHLSNAYLLVNETVYDIWGNDTYPIKKLSSKTGVPNLRHEEQDLEDLYKLSADKFVQRYNLFKTKFSKEYDAAVLWERRNNYVYPTFDNADKSEYAILVSRTFPYLYKKSLEILNTSGDANSAISNRLLNRILNDFVFLIEEFRQDTPISSDLIFRNPDRKKLSTEEISPELHKLIPSALFVNFILALSYKNTDYKRSINMLTEILKSDETGSEDAMQLWVKRTAEKEIDSYEATQNAASAKRTNSSKFFHQLEGTTSKSNVNFPSPLILN